MTALVVVKLGGAVVEDAPTLDALASELRELRAKGHAFALVHGGGVQLDAALKQLGEPVVKHKGLRITSQAAAAVVQRELDRVGGQLAQALAQRDVPAVHVPSTRGRLHATPKDLGDGVDLQRVGTATGYDATDLDPRGQENVPVITPVGMDDEGPLNVNADEGAASVAAAFHADLLFLATDVDHIRDEAGEAITTMDLTAARAFLGSSAAQGGMLPKVAAALSALEGGASRVLVARLSPGKLTAAVLEGRAPGTLIHDPKEDPR